MGLKGSIVGLSVNQASKIVTVSSAKVMSCGHSLITVRLILLLKANANAKLGFTNLGWEPAMLITRSRTLITCF